MGLGSRSLYGEVRGDLAGPVITQTDMGYTGQRAVSGTGLMDYRARFYDPLLYRFVQPDTIVPSAGDPQSWNRYSYSLNLPVKYNDPSGHSVDCAIGESECVTGTYVSPSVWELADFAISNGVKNIDPKYRRQIAKYMAYTLEYVIPKYEGAIDRQMTAYIFATIQLESLWGTQMTESCPQEQCEQKSVLEYDYYERIYGTGETAKTLGNDQPGDGYEYRGRGFVGFTGKDVYARLTIQLQSMGTISSDTSFVTDPSLLASDWMLSIKASIYSMFNGVLTGHTLSEYKIGDDYNYLGARDIVNPIDISDGSVGGGGRDDIYMLALGYLEILE